MAIEIGTTLPNAMTAEEHMREGMTGVTPFSRAMILFGVACAGVMACAGPLDDVVEGRTGGASSAGGSPTGGLPVQAGSGGGSTVGNDGAAPEEGGNVPADPLAHEIAISEIAIYQGVE